MKSLILSFNCQSQEKKRFEILHSAIASFRMTEEGILPLCRPFAEAQGFGSGLWLRTSAQGQNDRKRKLRMTEIGITKKKAG
jgi:hypothetical protein